MVPKESGFNQSVAASGMCARTMRDGKLVQMPHSCYHVETIRHPNCTERLHVDATIIRSFQKDYFNVSYRRCMPRTLAWRRAGLHHACQSSNMAILLTSLLFGFEISFLPKYRVNYYYDYIIKWCFGI